MLKSKIIFLVLFIVIATFFSLQFENVYGHGLGLDTIKSIDVNGKKISVSVEMPMYYTESNRQITITAIDDETKENVNNVTFLIGLFHDGEMILRDYFLAPEGVLFINVKPTNDDQIQILGEQDSVLGAWYATESQPLELSGPIFESGGLFHFEIEIKTIDDTTNILEDLGVHVADVSVVETTSYVQQDKESNDVNFSLKSYFDKISNFVYKPNEGMVTFSMPFDWSEKTISHIPIVHEEIHFPKDFEEFTGPSYIGTVNGIKLFKSSVTVDDYTEENERIIHFMLLDDHLRYLKNEQKKSNTELPDYIVFTLTMGTEIQFPMIALTQYEEFQVDLTWDPIEIEPGKKTIFIFTIRDGTTGDNLRYSTYDFVILQSGKEIYRTSGNAVVGGDFEEFTFLESQTGPTIIRFENIRGTNLDIEFGIVVIPEFSSIVSMIFALSIISVIFISKRNYLSKLNFS